VGELRRVEAKELIVGYAFDLARNTLKSRKIANPGAGRVHRFRAWRLKGTSGDRVTMREFPRRE